MRAMRKKKIGMKMNHDKDKNIVQTEESPRRYPVPTEKALPNEPYTSINDNCHAILDPGLDQPISCEQPAFSCVWII